MTLTPAVLAVPKPSLGRIVIIHEAGEEFAAIVTGVCADPLTIHVTAFAPGLAGSALINVPHSVLQLGSPFWTWPARV